MTAQVIYLNRWLNCPDDILRKHYSMQELINTRKAEFWYSVRGIDRYQAVLAYSRFVHSMRNRMGIIKGGEILE